jgi:hypothetical protein
MDHGVELIKQVRFLGGALIDLDASDINLILGSLNAELVDPETWHSNGYGWELGRDEKKQLLYSILTTLGGVKLAELAETLQELSKEPNFLKPRAQETQLVPLFLFASHLNKQRSLVSEIGDKLQLLGVRLFVAHESIKPTTDFQIEIQQNLASVHGAIFFLNDGFGSSAWCDQEVGWILGRGVPYYSLKFGSKAPHGFVARNQALTVGEKTSQERIINELVSWIANSDALRPRFIDSLIVALSQSNLFSATDTLWKHLRGYSGLSPAQIDFLLEATMQNNQIHGTNSRVGTPEEGKGRPYAEVIRKFVASQDNFNLESKVVEKFDRRFKKFELDSPF